MNKESCKSYKTYCFDLDQTLCFTKGNDYKNSLPIPEMVDKVNYLHDNGNCIKIYTARGMGSFQGDIARVNEAYLDLTKNQLNVWGVKYHELHLGKISYDYIIDDKNLTIDDFKKIVQPKVGLVTGVFDILHPGYIKLFKEAKTVCDKLLVALHKDSSVENKNKFKPIISLGERIEVLHSIKYIDDVIVYETEEDLYNLLKSINIDVRVMGDDYINKNFTGKDLNIKIHFADRSHGWSYSNLRKKIYDTTLIR